MLLQAFFPLAVLILSVLGAILFGLATPCEAAAMPAPSAPWRWRIAHCVQRG